MVLRALSSSCWAARKWRERFWEWIGSAKQTRSTTKGRAPRVSCGVRVGPALPAAGAAALFLDWYTTGLAGSPGYRTASCCTVADLVHITADPLEIMGINNTRPHFPHWGSHLEMTMCKDAHRCPHLLHNLSLKPCSYKGFKKMSIQRGKCRGRH